MKHLLSFLLAAIAVLVADSAAAQDASCTGHDSPYRLHVDVEGVQSSNGLIAVTLYPDVASKFLAHHGSLYVGRVPAKMGTTEVCIHLPRLGTYAVAVYHDANANRHIDRTAIGLPAEGFGFSNNPHVFLGMPAWRSVRLPVPQNDMHTAIKLRYP
jgi:uncharacterized protein (DUF2141 family)